MPSPVVVVTVAVVDAVLDLEVVVDAVFTLMLQPSSLACCPRSGSSREYCSLALALAAVRDAALSC